MRTRPPCSDIAQKPSLKAWKGQAANVPAAQAARGGRWGERKQTQICLPFPNIDRRRGTFREYQVFRDTDVGFKAQLRQPMLGHRRLGSH
jgi:hypothetical protein